MSFLYRSAITITRGQPYLDWANGTEAGGPELTKELAASRRTVYLVEEFETDEPDLRAIVDDHWEYIFETELELWTDDHDVWPSPLTRELFDAWFSVEATDSVVDLLPQEPLTHAQVELADLEEALGYCAWCGLEVDETNRRFAGFKVAQPDRLEPRRGLTWPIVINDEEVLVGMVPPADSEEAEDHDLVFRVCGSRCEKALRSVVSRALRREARKSGREDASETGDSE
jgi:hypothetical protein